MTYTIDVRCYGCKFCGLLYRDGVSVAGCAGDDLGAVVCELEAKGKELEKKEKNL